MNPAEFDNIARCERELWWFRGMERIFFRFARPFASGRAMQRVLEAGCGTGAMSQAMLRELGWPLYPADLAAQGLEHATAMGLTRLTQSNVLAQPFRDNSFDCVVCLDVIAHLTRGEDLAAFQEFQRILKPGGLLLLRTAALSILRSRHSEFVGERQRYTASRLQLLCRESGLQVLRLTYLNSLLMPVALFKFRIWEPLTGAPPASGVALPAPWLNRLLEVPLRLEERLIGAGAALPAGQSLLLAAVKS
jgi:SAM-dependent methyltransferase